MAQKSGPVRVCTGCGRRKEKVELVRLVADPSGSVIPDLKGSLPSRGAYVCPDKGCIEKACKGRLRASLKLPGGSSVSAREVGQAVAEACRRRVCSLLGQARKSGKCISGTNLVEAEVRRGARPEWLAVLAGDASADISEKIRKSLVSAGVPCTVFLDKDGIGRSLGKSPRSVVLVKDAGMAKAIVQSVDRWHRVLDKGGLDR